MRIENEGPGYLDNNSKAPSRVDVKKSLDQKRKEEALGQMQIFSQTFNQKESQNHIDGIKVTSQQQRLKDQQVAKQERIYRIQT